MSRLEHLTDRDKQQYWYVEDLPTDRPTRRRLNRDAWIREVDRLLTREEKGHRVLHTLDGTLDIEGNDRAKFKQILREIIVEKGWRMFWEPAAPRQTRSEFAMDDQGRRFLRTLFGDLYPGTPEYKEFRREQRQVAMARRIQRKTGRSK